MKRYLAIIVFAVVVFPVFAHVPYLEHKDYTERAPFGVDDIEHSIAVYAWFYSGTDVDVYKFTVTEPVRVTAQAIVPICEGNENLLPWLAVVGPGFPIPEQALPFELPRGYGAIVVENLEPGDPREAFYEPFGGKAYYDGAIFDQEISDPGDYYVYYWDPYEVGGDYVAILGWEETFSGADILRSAVNTPIIRNDGELHTECVVPN